MIKINNYFKGILVFYEFAKKSVNQMGFSPEGEWQNSLSYSTFNEEDLLREAAWVILCSGFKEAIVRNKFDYISLCFCDWESSREILKNKNQCRATALHAIRNTRKIQAIGDIANLIAKDGFDKIKHKIISNPINELQKFPYIGRITSYHLAKNLGFDVAKPDRHLLRLAQYAGIGDVQKMCSIISGKSGDPIPYVDLILWRYLEQNSRFEPYYDFRPRLGLTIPASFTIPLFP